MSIKLEFITLHDTDQLSAILGEAIASRETLHEWTLSSVERITTAGGKTYIYKSQWAKASVERAFYEKFSHPLLTKPVWAGEIADCEALILPDLGSPRADWEQMSAEESRALTERLSREIQQFEAAPVFYDLSRPERLPEMLAEVRAALAENGVTEAELSRLQAWTEGPARICWDAPVGLVHGDLKGDNVLFTPDGQEKLIDWQRPMRAPLPLETAYMLHTTDHEADSPGPFGALAEFVIMYWFAWGCVQDMRTEFRIEHSALHARRCLEFIG